MPDYWAAVVQRNGSIRRLAKIGANRSSLDRVGSYCLERVWLAIARCRANWLLRFGTGRAFHRERDPKSMSHRCRKLKLAKTLRLARSD
jgi:hypothetical protein